MYIEGKSFIGSVLLGSVTAYSVNKTEVTFNERLHQEYNTNKYLD